MCGFARPMWMLMCEWLGVLVFNYECLVCLCSLSFFDSVVRCLFMVVGLSFFGLRLWLVWCLIFVCFLCLGCVRVVSSLV